MSERAGEHLNTKATCSCTSTKCNCAKQLATLLQGCRVPCQAQTGCMWRLATTKEYLTSKFAEAHHIHRGVLTMNTVASVYSI